MKKELTPPWRGFNISQKHVKLRDNQPETYGHGNSSIKLPDVEYFKTAEDARCLAFKNRPFFCVFLRGNGLFFKPPRLDSFLAGVAEKFDSSKYSAFGIFFLGINTGIFASFGQVCFLERSFFSADYCRNYCFKLGHPGDNFSRYCHFIFSTCPACVN